MKWNVPDGYPTYDKRLEYEEEAEEDVEDDEVALEYIAEAMNDVNMHECSLVDAIDGFILDLHTSTEYALRMFEEVGVNCDTYRQEYDL